MHPLLAVGRIFRGSHQRALHRQIDGVLRQSQKRTEKQAFACAVPRFIRDLRSLDLEKRIQHPTGVKLVDLYVRVLDERAAAYEDACHFGIMDHLEL